ncbi:hypothetical protein L596_012598 [Steinernema carpocapsae]|uniref:7TM GPCR serpentine receptor class x (Srx) domain-containing protein n=1 Tax=Steinernema carpocapsae TaxID=34508 RepID=A0A4U5NXW1_STECR|nr:hypothetical protein L596_012598 [Steinernema carpocapsae]
MFTEAENVWAALAIFTIGLTGVIVNSIVIYGVFHKKIFGYAFGTGCISHTLANLGITATFTFIVVPITLIDPGLHDTYLVSRSGQFLIFCYFLNEFSHLFLAINRCVIVYFPLKYSKIFTKSTCKVIMAFIVTFSFLLVIPHFWRECGETFLMEKLGYYLRETKCSQTVIIHMVYDLSIAVVRVTLSQQASQGEQKNRFFFQSLAQAINFMVELVIYFAIAPLVTNSWAYFVLTTLAWISVHTVDGCIVIAFNKRVMFKPLKATINGMQAARNVSNAISLFSRRDVSES